MDNSVSTKVAETIANLSPAVEDKVVAALTDRELKKRSDALVIVIDKLSALEADMKKIKPDQVFYDEQGKVTSSYYSKKKLDEKNKLQQKIDNYSKAINTALEKSEFKNVYGISSGKEPDAPGENTGDAEEAA